MQQKYNDILSLERINRFNPTIWSVIIGTLIARTSYYMAWPFLIVILYRDYNTSATEVGMTLGLSALVSVLFGFYAGYISDRLGRKWIIILGCFISVFAYFEIARVSNLGYFYFLIILCGLTRPMIEDTGKALISDNLDDVNDRELALNFRYFAINVGGALGPLLGIQIALSTPQALFGVTAMVYLIFACWLLIIFYHYPESARFKQQHAPSFFNAMQVLKRDKRLLQLVFANTLMMFVYAHFSSTIPQILTREGSDHVEFIIAGLVMINTLTIVFCQFPVLKVMQHFTLISRVKIGISLMGIAQLLFIFSPMDSLLSWFMAAFVLSLGEVIAFPTINVQIDRLAPEHLRGLYFGASSVQFLGFALAPMIGGIMLDRLPADSVFVLCAVLCLIMLLMYHKLK